MEAAPGLLPRSLGEAALGPDALTSWSIRFGPAEIAVDDEELEVTLRFATLVRLDEPPPA